MVAGAVFELTPTRSGEWGFKTLYSFKGAPDGVFPYGALLFDAAGNLYGTTYYGGTTWPGHSLPIVAQRRRRMERNGALQLQSWE